MDFKKLWLLIMLLVPMLITSCVARRDLFDLARIEPPDYDGQPVYSDLAVVGAAATSNGGVRVYFSDDVEKLSAETTDNYLIPGLAVTSAVRCETDYAVVDLTTSSQSAVTYVLTVNKVEDLQGRPIGFNNIASFFGDELPYVQSAGSYSNTEVRIYFSEPVEEASAEDTTHYSITGLAIVSASRDSVDHTQVTLITESQGDGTPYTLSVDCVQDLAGNCIAEPNAYGFNGTGVVDTTPPQLLSAVLYDQATVELRFSEPVEQASSESEPNYGIIDYDSNDVDVSTATRQTDQSKVFVEVSDIFTRSSYTVTVSTAVQDLSGNFLVGPPANEAIFTGLGTVIVDAVATSPTSVRVYFSTDVELSKAQNIGNYSIPSLTVNSASRDAVDFSIVDLLTTDHSDTNYLLTVVNVIDQDSKNFQGDIPPYIESVTSTSNTELSVYFSEAVDETSAENVSNYYVLTLSILNATRDAVDYSKVILETASQSGSTLYTLEVSNIRDLNLNIIVDPRTMQFDGTGPVDTTEPYVLSAELVDGNTASVQFSEPVEQSSAESVSNYAIEDSVGDPVTVISATRQSDTSKVWLDITGSFTDSFYEVTVSTDVRDLSGLQLSGPPDNRASFSGEGAPPESFFEGPIVIDPFSETVEDFSRMTEYRDRVYMGPGKSDDSLFRIRPNGTEPEIVTMTFYAGSTLTHDLESGPDGEEGIDCFAGGIIGGQEYLFIGPAKTNGDLRYIYFTSENGTTLNFVGMDLGSMLGPQTKGVSSMIVFNDCLYIGFPDDGGSRPYLLKISNIVTDPVPGSDVVDLEGDNIPRIGCSATPMNDSSKIAIDSFGVYNDRLYLANGGKNDIDADGGIVQSANGNPSAGDWIDVTPTSHSRWYEGGNRFSIELQDLIYSKVPPSEKAFPQMTVFNDKLYVIRNTTGSPEGPQLWKYDGAVWEIVADNGSGLSNMGDADNERITLLVANDDRLYIGFDNTVDGVQVYRTNVGVVDPVSEGDFEHLITDGLGDPADNQKIYDGISVADTTTHYLWLLCGRDGVDLRVFRTNND